MAPFPVWQLAPSALKKGSQILDHPLSSRFPRKSSLGSSIALALDGAVKGAAMGCPCIWVRISLARVVFRHGGYVTCPGRSCMWLTMALGLQRVPRQLAAHAPMARQSLHSLASLSQVQIIHFHYAQSIMTLCKTLKLRFRVAATACVYFKRFYLHQVHPPRKKSHITWPTLCTLMRLIATNLGLEDAVGACVLGNVCVGGRAFVAWWVMCLGPRKRADT